MPFLSFHIARCIQPKNNFDWSLKPIFILGQCVGLHLMGNNGRKLRILRFIVILGGFATFLMNLYETIRKIQYLVGKLTNKTPSLNDIDS